MTLRQPERGRHRAARLVVVAASGCDFADAVRRVGFPHVGRLHDVAAARVLCSAGAVDACIVVLPAAVPDELPPWTAETQAPGGDRVPSLLVADALTRYVRVAARKAGYHAAIPRGLSARMLYRRIGALLQASRQRRANTRKRVRSAESGSALVAAPAAAAGKSRLQ